MAPDMRVVSGIQPTGGLHLGNLLGAILRWVRMQDEAECLFFLADLHALTVDVDPAELRANVREMAAALIASGIDPAKSILFRQSAVPAHAELAWLLQCTARMGWLNRMTQFKDKAGKNKEGASRRPVHLSGAPGRRHPALPCDPCAGRRGPEAAYRAGPRHRHQVQHRLRHRAVRAARAVHRRRHGGAGHEPARRQGENVQVRPVGHEPHQPHRQRRHDRRRRSARRRPTPSRCRTIPPARRRPEAKNLVGIYAAVTGESVEAVLGRFAGQGFGAFKPALADALVALIAPLRARLERLARRSRPSSTASSPTAPRKARELAAPTLAAAYRAVGLTPLISRFIAHSARFVV